LKGKECTDLHIETKTATDRWSGRKPIQGVVIEEGDA